MLRSGDFFLTHRKKSLSSKQIKTLSKSGEVIEGVAVSKIKVT
jgi:hypothetical protein